MARDKDVINAIVAQAVDAAKELTLDKQIELLTALSQLDPSVLQSEAFVTWAKQPEMQERLEAFGIKVKLFEGHAVAFGKGGDGDRLAEATSRAATLRDLFSSLGMAMDCSIKSGKIDGASVAIQLTVK